MSEKTFHFGKNWQAYLAGHFSEQALHTSTESLRRFVGSSLTGKTVVDVGCGSGIHSLGALMLGAERVVSFDADPASVEGTRQLKAKLAPNSNWEILQGSMLDEEFVRSLGTFDMVYCWGVAHHTGALWKALDTIQALVREHGLLYIAIYNTVEGRFGSSWWHFVKKTYNHVPRSLQKLMEWGYIAFSILGLLVRLRNPFAFMKKYRDKRGMELTTDLVDWLGGYPYEHAKVEEVFNFYKKHEMQLVNIKTTNYIGCNEFLFYKP